jgi:hypothetical protein
MRATARLVGINLGVFAAGLLLIEAVFGDWIFGPHLGYLSIARDVVYRHDVSRVDPRRDVIAYTRDRYGLRGDYGGEPSKIDVLVMGGSTTAEGYVDDTDSWSPCSTASSPPRAMGSRRSMPAFPAIRRSPISAASTCGCRSFPASGPNT